LAALLEEVSLDPTFHISALILPSKPSVVRIIIKATGGKVQQHFPA
jgi:hypothetical protein